MSTLKVGDRVRLDDDHGRFGYSGVGTVRRLTSVGDYVLDFEEVFVSGMPEATAPGIGFPLSRLTLLDSPFVNVIENRSIWITLPGDIAGHRLTEEQAKQLLWELEAAV